MPIADALWDERKIRNSRHRRKEPKRCSYVEAYMDLQKCPPIPPVSIIARIVPRYGDDWEFLADPANRFQNGKKKWSRWVTDFAQRMVNEVPEETRKQYVDEVLAKYSVMVQEYEAAMTNYTQRLSDAVGAIVAHNPKWWKWYNY